MDKKSLKKMSLEETFASVNDILDKLSKDELPLEDSFSLYKDGMELISHCGEIIDEVEKQIIVLQGEDEQ